MVTARGRDQRPRHRHVPAWALPGRNPQLADLLLGWAIGRDLPFIEKQR